MSTLKIKKGDTVKVIAGKDRDTEGKVISVDAEKGKVVVDGGIVQKEAPIDISNVMLVVKGKATRVGFKMDGDKKVRFAKATGEVID